MYMLLAMEFLHFIYVPIGKKGAVIQSIQRCTLDRWTDAGIVIEFVNGMRTIDVLQEVFDHA